MQSTEFDYLIVGQGLAGSLLAMHLIQAGKSIVVVDKIDDRSATKVAAGLINPVTGHRWNMTQNFNHYLEKAKINYLAVEKLTGYRVLHPVMHERLVKNAGQSDYLRRRLNDPDYVSILEKCESVNFKQTDYGSVRVKDTYIVDTNVLLEACTQHISRCQIRIDEIFDYEALIETASGFTYGDVGFKKIVFCEGYQATNNPWLADFPFKLSKGSVLDVEIKEGPGQVLTWGHWLIPNPQNKKLYRLGSSYEWHKLSLDIDKKTERKILESLNKHTHYRPKLIKHQVGIRPTTLHRRPFVAGIPSLPNAYVLNGLGSKGCLSAPYWVNELVNHMEHSVPLPSEANPWA